MPPLDPDTAELLAELEELERELVDEDKINMDSTWHRMAMTLLIESLSYYLRHREDFYVGGNCFIYFSQQQVRNKDFRGPDFFFVDSVPRWPLRRFWVVWKEAGRYPDVIIELTSPTTEDEDHGIKKRVYEKTFHTREYYCYDPRTQSMEGWRLGSKDRYRSIHADERGWMWCEKLQLWLGPWRGRYVGAEEVWLRFYDAEGKLVLTQAEAEEAHAEQQKQRADELAAEVARLRALLGERHPGTE
jgi:Uma2 family endonuclease